MRTTAWVLGMALLAWGQEPAKGYGADRAALDTWVAKEAAKLGEALQKAKWVEEARALLEVLREKSEAESTALDRLIEKCGPAPKAAPADAWPDGARGKLKEFGKEAAKRHWAVAKKWGAAEPEACRWLFTEGEILEELLEYLQAHRILNEFRHRAGVPRAKFSWKLSVPCVWHCKYAAKHPDDEEEDPSKPEYTKEGEAARKNTIGYFNNPLLSTATISTNDPFQRHYLLNPNLRIIGYGSPQSDSLSLIDIRGGITPSADNQLLITLSPTDGESEVDLGAPDTGDLIHGQIPLSKCGMPITAILFNTDMSTWSSIDCQLTTSLGLIECHSGTPLNPFAPEGIAARRNTIMLVPKKPLPKKTTFTATITLSNTSSKKVITWSFTTRS